MSRRSRFSARDTVAVLESNRWQNSFKAYAPTETTPLCYILRLHLLFFGTAIVPQPRSPPVGDHHSLLASEPVRRRSVKSAGCRGIGSIASSGIGCHCIRLRPLWKTAVVTTVRKRIEPPRKSGHKKEFIAFRTLKSVEQGEDDNQSKCPQACQNNHERHLDGICRIGEIQFAGKQEQPNAGNQKYSTARNAAISSPYGRIGTLGLELRHNEWCGCFCPLHLGKRDVLLRLVRLSFFKGAQILHG